MIKFWQLALIKFVKNSPEISQEEFEENSKKELLIIAKDLIFFKLQNEDFVKNNEKILKSFFQKSYESYESENQSDSSSCSLNSEESNYSNDEDNKSVSSGFLFVFLIIFLRIVRF